MLLSPEAQWRKHLWKPYKPCHVGIHWIALTESFQMNTQFAKVLVIFQLFCIILY